MNRFTIHGTTASDVFEFDIDVVCLKFETQLMMAASFIHHRVFLSLLLCSLQTMWLD